MLDEAINVRPQNWTLENEMDIPASPFKHLLACFPIPLLPQRAGKGEAQGLLVHGCPPGKSPKAVQPCCEKFFAFQRTQIITTSLAVQSRKRGVSGSSRTRGWMRWTRQRRARRCVRRAVSRERTTARGRTALQRLG